MFNSLPASADLRPDEPAAASAQGIVDRKDLASFAVERTRMPMAMSDMRQPDSPIVWANAAFLNLTGYQAAEVIGRNCRFLQGADTSEADVREVAAALLEERELTIELLNYRKDGSSFWNRLHLSPIHDADGRLSYYFASQTDVTEQRRLEEIGKRLRREVDHRTLNTLAIVSGIVRLSHSDNSVEYAASVQQRVQALVKTHAMLAEGDWGNIPLEKLLGAQTESFGDDRVEMAGPTILLNPILVQPLAIVFHELAMNAAAHGALSVPTGKLQVRWKQDHADDLVEVIWLERGGPAPLSKRPAGFGSKMIKAIVQRQLRGTLQETWDRGGLQAHVTIPLSRAA